MSNEPYLTRHYYGEKNASEELRLSLFISSSAFMYALSGDGEFTEVCEVTISPSPGKSLVDHVEFLVNNHQLQRGRYSRIHIAVLNQQFTMLPDAFYSPDHARKLLAFTTGEESRNIGQNQVHNVRFCYAVEPEVAAYLERTFSNAVIRHAGSISLCLLFSHHSLAHAGMFVNINGNLCEIGAKDNGELAFYNVFTCETDEDFLYYILFTMEQLRLDPATVRLAVAADRLVTDHLLATLKKYVKHLSFCAPDTGIRLSGELAHIPNHCFFTLLHQHQCEL